MANTKLNSNLSALSVSAARAERAEQNIVSAASERLGVVNERIAALRPKSSLHGDSAREYQDLIEERGRLDLVISRARIADS